MLKLQEERLQEYRDEGYDIDSMDDEEIIELDDKHILGRGCISLTLADPTADDWVVWEEEDF